MPTKNTCKSSTSRYYHDCSVKRIASNFMKIRKDASVSKPITTGSKTGDYAVGKIPGIGKYIKAGNWGSSIGANVSHAINAYNESCGNRKKK